jgi:hypothetical protein
MTPHAMSHKIFERALLGLLVLCLLPALFLRGATTASQELGQFPAIQATSLDKAKLRLPQDFAGQLNLVVISFAREQQQEVDTWIPVARQIQSGHSNFSYYELATTARENLLYRWWFDAALRSNTTDKELRSRILTAYVSKHSFQKTLHIANEKKVVAVLVDRSGKVYWRAEGSCTEQTKLALQSALAANGV